jgi:hypothetical protein
MSWWNILKRIEILPEEKLLHLDEFIKAEDKGYPSVIHPLNIVADFDDDTGKLKGYTSFKEFDKFYFVGNSFSFVKGSYGEVLKYRDSKLGSDKAQVTLLNPLKGTDTQRLFDMVEKRGGLRIEEYSQVDDIMSEDMYNQMKVLPMFRYRPYKED